MAKILLVFATVEGQTEKIAEVIATELKSQGHSVRLRDVQQMRRPGPLCSFDGVIVGAPVHASGFPAELTRWATDHADQLGARPGAFFSVCLGILQKNDVQAQEDVRRFVTHFFSTTGWYPARWSIFAGALAYSRYGFLKRQVMRWIAWRAGGDTDASRDHEYTDWNEVREFARSFGSGLVSARSEQPRDNLAHA